jgi:hypothetical protein
LLPLYKKLDFVSVEVKVMSLSANPEFQALMHALLSQPLIQLVHAAFAADIHLFVPVSHQKTDRRIGESLKLSNNPKKRYRTCPS